MLLCDDPVNGKNTGLIVYTHSFPPVWRLDSLKHIMMPAGSRCHQTLHGSCLTCGGCLQGSEQPLQGKRREQGRHTIRTAPPQHWLPSYQAATPQTVSWLQLHVAACGVAESLYPSRLHTAPLRPHPPSTPHVRPSRMGGGDQVNPRSAQPATPFNACSHPKSAPIAP